MSQPKERDFANATLWFQGQDQHEMAGHILVIVRVLTKRDGRLGGEGLKRQARFGDGYRQPSKTRKSLPASTGEEQCLDFQNYDAGSCDFTPLTMSICCNSPKKLPDQPLLNHTISPCSILTEC